MSKQEIENIQLIIQSKSVIIFGELDRLVRQQLIPKEELEIIEYMAKELRLLAFKLKKFR